MRPISMRWERGKLASAPISTQFLPAKLSAGCSASPWLGAGWRDFVFVVPFPATAGYSLLVNDAYAKGIQVQLNRACRNVASDPLSVIKWVSFGYDAALATLSYFTNHNIQLRERKQEMNKHHISVHFLSLIVSNYPIGSSNKHGTADDQQVSSPPPQSLLSIPVIVLNLSIYLKCAGFGMQLACSLFIALLSKSGAAGTLTNGVKGYLIWLSLLPAKARQKSSLPSLKALNWAAHYFNQTKGV